MKKINNILELKKSKELIKFFKKLGLDQIYSQYQFDCIVIYIMRNIIKPKGINSNIIE